LKTSAFFCLSLLVSSYLSPGDEIFVIIEKAKQKAKPFKKEAWNFFTRLYIEMEAG
jgi:hypothetical protein